MPFPVIAAAGLLMSAAGSAFGAAKSAQQNKKTLRYLKDYDRDSQNLYNETLLDGTQSASAQRNNTMMRKLFFDSSENLAGQHEVGHTTRAAQASEKARMNEAMADAYSQQVVNQESINQQAKQQRMADKQWVAGQKANVATAQAQQASTAASNLASNVGSFLTAYGQQQLTNPTTPEATPAYTEEQRKAAYALGGGMASVQPIQNQINQFRYRWMSGGSTSYQHKLKVVE